MAGAKAQKKLDGVLLHRLDISICDAQDLLMLSEYDIVLVVDDSGSMRRPNVPRSMQRPGVQYQSRWEELRETLTLLIEVAACLDADGLDIHFLNMGSVHNVRSAKEPALEAILARGPGGGTPLTETVSRVVADPPGEKPVLMVILTDGEPNGGPRRFKEVVQRAISQRNIRFQIMACTGEEKELAWLNDFDDEFDEVDVTDDYASEREEVLRAGHVRAFSRADWVMKALLGPIDPRFDGMDEAGGGRKRRGGGAKELLGICPIC